jgi:hypothetical protein
VSPVAAFDLAEAALGTALVYARGEPTRLSKDGERRGVRGEDVEAVRLLVERLEARTVALGVILEPDPIWLQSAPKQGRKVSLRARREALHSALTQAGRWLADTKPAPAADRLRWRRAAQALLNELGYLESRATARVHHGWPH